MRKKGDVIGDGMQKDNDQMSEETYCAVNKFFLSCPRSNCPYLFAAELLLGTDIPCCGDSLFLPPPRRP